MRLRKHVIFARGMTRVRIMLHESCRDLLVMVTFLIKQKEQRERVERRKRLNR